MKYVWPSMIERFGSDYRHLATEDSMWEFHAKNQIGRSCSWRRSVPRTCHPHPWWSASVSTSLNTCKEIGTTYRVPLEELVEGRTTESVTHLQNLIFHRRVSAIEACPRRLRAVRCRVTALQSSYCNFPLGKSTVGQQ